MKSSKLEDDEKIFIIAHLLDAGKSHKKLKGTISLYTYLDGTNEPIKQQEIQLKTNDVDLSQWINLIRSDPTNNSIESYVRNALERQGYTKSKTFIDNFNKIILWLKNKKDVNQYIEKFDELKNKSIKHKPAQNLKITISPWPFQQFSSTSRRTKPLNEHPITDTEHEDRFLKKCAERNFNEQRAIKQIEVFSTEFRDIESFQKAIVYLQIKINGNLDVVNYYDYLYFDFTDTEESVIRRWEEKYINILEELKQVKNKKIKQERESQLKHYQHVKTVLNRSKANQRSQSLNETQTTTDQWGRKIRPRLNDDGNSWREQN